MKFDGAGVDLVSVGDRNGNFSRGGSPCGTCSPTTNDRAACDAEWRDADFGEASQVISDSGHILTLTLHVVDTPTHTRAHTQSARTTTQMAFTRPQAVPGLPACFLIMSTAAWPT